ncbi:MAG: DUF4154 domain-containing protein [Algicola sp.]|nr:DUF4154 domain-containing protein [Algicola sp.]
MSYIYPVTIIRLHLPINLLKTLLLCFFLQLTVLHSSAVAAEFTPAELKASRVKATFVYQISKFITWKNEQSIETFYFGIVGQDKGLFDVLSAMNGELKHGNKPVYVERIKDNNLGRVAAMHLVFVTVSAKDKLRQIARLARHTNTLIITENHHLKSDFMLNLVFKKGDKAHFEFNSSNMVAEGLTIKDRLSALGSEIIAEQLLRETEDSMFALQGEMQNKVIELGKLHQQNQQQSTLLLEKTQQLRSAEQKLVNAAKQLIDIQVLLQQTRQGLDEQKLKLGASEAELAQQKQQIKQKEQQINTLTGDVTTVQDNLEQLKTAETTLQAELDLKRADIESLGITVSRLVYGLSVLLGVLALVSFYVQRKKVQMANTVNRKLQRVDKLKDEFLANTSHELKTPLNGIIGLAESLIDGVAGQLPENANKNLAMVVASGKRLSNLVNDILDFSKLKNRNLSLNTKPVDLKSLVEVVLTLSRPLVGDKTLKLTNAISDDIPAILADEDRVQQILYNLVGNAIKFTVAGEVTVGADVLGKKDLGEQVSVTVTDTGIGIAQDQFATIFDSFEQVEGHDQRQYSGTGLGLAVSKQLVELHGGSIGVKSTLGFGSTFSFSLPITGDAIQSDICTERAVARLHRLDYGTVLTPQQNGGNSIVQNSIGHKNSGQNGDQSLFRILLVDDEPINRQVLLNHLSLQNYQLTEVTGGQEALDAIENQAPFDLVLLDLMMPKVSGYQVCKKLRETYPATDLVVIFLTAKNQVADLVQSFEVGANDYLSKPVSKYELLTRVETHLKFLDINRNLERKVFDRTNELVHAEKMASLGTLTAGVAHEINNPTNFVHVSTQNLMADLENFQQFLFKLAGEDAEQAILDSFNQRFKPMYQHLATIKDGTQRIQLIVKDLRAFTQLDAADHKTVVITECLQSTINLVKTKNNSVAKFSTEFVDAPKLLCYPAQLNQVFMNLIVNACDAIRAKLRQQKDDTPGQVIGGCRVVDEHIEITVKDDGCGMNEQTKKKLFEPFYTTKDVGEGTGLGLSISYGIVQKHGGELSVESVLGEGSVFKLTLPITDL